MWQAVEGLPERCEVEVAINPRAALPDLNFRSCPDLGDDVCREVAVTWRAPRPAQLGREAFRPQESGFVDASRSLFHYRRPGPPGEHEYTYHAIATDSGGHLAVFRDRFPDLESEYWCNVNDLAPAEDGFVGTISHRGSLATESGTYVVRGDYSAPARLEQLWSGASPTITGFAQRAVRGEGFIGLWTTPPVEVVRIEDSGEVHTVCAVGPEVPLCVLRDAVGPYLLADVFGPTQSIAIAGEDDATLRPYVDDSAFEDGEGFSDGADLAWMRASPDYVDSAREWVELWASPFAPRSEDLVPRRIGTLLVPDINNSFALGNGRVWNAEIEDETEPNVVRHVVHNLATGERRVYRPGADEGVGPGYVHVGSEDIGVPVYPSGRRRGATTLRFIRYEALAVEPVPE